MLKGRYVNNNVNIADFNPHACATIALMRRMTPDIITVTACVSRAVPSQESAPVRLSNFLSVYIYIFDSTVACDVYLRRVL